MEVNLKSLVDSRILDILESFIEISTTFLIVFGRRILMKYSKFTIFACFEDNHNHNRLINTFKDNYSIFWLFQVFDKILLKLTKNGTEIFCRNYEKNFDLKISKIDKGTENYQHLQLNN